MHNPECNSGHVQSPLTSTLKGLKPFWDSFRVDILRPRVALGVIEITALRAFSGTQLTNGNLFKEPPPLETISQLDLLEIIIHFPYCT